MVPGPLGPTWEVPAFAAGHAEFSAGAGRPGTAVLFGHVSSLRSGRVFQHLERVRAGDDIEVVSGDEGFLYRVVEVQRVPRTSVLTLEPSATAGIVLITCTGQWLPALGDYAERLIVRGQLVG